MPKAKSEYVTKTCEYVTKTCSSCKGKGTVQHRVEKPGEFSVQLSITASFDMKWDDASETSASYVQKLVKELIESEELLICLESELNCRMSKKKISIDVTSQKIK